MPRPRNFDDDVVVERAMEAFWTHGYANTSPAQLAEATGIAKGSLYNAFGSKRELFQRALARYDVLGREAVEALLSVPGSTRDRIRTLLRTLVDVDLAGPVRRGCLMVNTTVEFGGADAEMTRTVRAIGEHTTAALLARLEQGRRDGDVSPDLDVPAYADFLANTIVGLRVMAKASDAPTLHRIIDTALATL